MKAMPKDCIFPGDPPHSTTAVSSSERLSNLPKVKLLLAVEAGIGARSVGSSLSLPQQRLSELTWHRAQQRKGVSCQQRTVAVTTVQWEKHCPRGGGVTHQCPSTQARRSDDRPPATPAESYLSSRPGRLHIELLCIQSPMTRQRRSNC